MTAEGSAHLPRPHGGCACTHCCHSSAGNSCSRLERTQALLGRTEKNTYILHGVYVTPVVLLRLFCIVQPTVFPRGPVKALKASSTQINSPFAEWHRENTDYQQIWFNSSLNIPVQSSHWYFSAPDPVNRQTIGVYSCCVFSVYVSARGSDMNDGTVHEWKFEGRKIRSDAKCLMQLVWICRAWRLRIEIELFGGL